jgi:hypothetical protein
MKTKLRGNTVTGFRPYPAPGMPPRPPAAFLWKLKNAPRAVGAHLCTRMLKPVKPDSWETHSTQQAMEGTIGSQVPGAQALS